MNERRVIICRSVKDGLIPFYRTGYKCVVCDEPLQISATGLAHLTSDPAAPTICNECGLLYVRLAEGAGGVIETEMSPDAKAQLASGNDSPLAQMMRRRKA